MDPSDEWCGAALTNRNERQDGAALSELQPVHSHETVSGKQIRGLFLIECTDLIALAVYQR